MKKLFLLTTGIAALTIASSTSSLAQPAPKAPPAQERLWNPAKIKEKLGLTDEQMAQIKAEFRAQKGPIKEQAQKVRAARVNLRNAVQSAAPEKDIRAAAATLGAAEGDLAVVRAALFAHILPLLTPEQVGKLHEWQAQAR